VLPGPKDKRGQPPCAEKKEWRCTTKPGKFFLHFFRWPAGQFKLDNVSSTVARAYFLADRERRPLRFTQAGAGLTIDLPAQAPNSLASVVCLELLP
jgi:alpha-L-fucosidase